MRNGRIARGAVGLAALLVSIVHAVAVQNDGVRRASANGGAAAAVIVPHESWSCGLPNGIPNPESGTLVFDVTMTLDRVADVGKTQYGRRTVAIVHGGDVRGPRLTASVTAGALDFELTLANGVIEIEQRLVMLTSDGKYILVRSAGTGPDAKDVRLVMDFEAPNVSDAAWLNSGTYVARRMIDPAGKTMTLHVYQVSSVTPPPDGRGVVRITKPPGVPPQPWDYRRAAPGEKPGAQVITERVTLSPSQSVGASKRGNRNIIPITGGDVSGRISGKVVSAGADYQNLSPPATIDAHYLWQSSDGEIVIVRNGGAFGSLVPTFEARVDGPYAWLNTGMFLSSNPQGSPGGVALTFFESTR
jgi:hypothetical protein